MLSWIFLDLGGPVIDDGPWSAHVRGVIRKHLATEGLSAPCRIFADVERQVKATRQPSFLRSLVEAVCRSPGQADRVWDAIQATLDRTNLDAFCRLNPLQRGAADAIRRLAGCYRLATVSNNLRLANQLLQRHGLWSSFSVMGNSAEIGIRKPDLRIFEFVLRQAGCRPCEVLMVGDRLDNDIAPAKRLGMRTARIRVGWYRDVEPDCEEERAELEAHSLAALVTQIVLRDP